MQYWVTQQTRSGAYVQMTADDWRRLLLELRTNAAYWPLADRLGRGLPADDGQHVRVYLSASELLAVSEIAALIEVTS